MSTHDHHQCLACGEGEVAPRRQRGRSLRVARGVSFTVPEHFDVPTCSMCGEMELDEGWTERVAMEYRLQGLRAVEADRPSRFPVHLPKNLAHAGPVGTFTLSAPSAPPVPFPP